MMFHLNNLAFRLLADGVPNVKPNNNYPASDIILKIVAWGLALLVLAGAVNIIYQIFKLRQAGEAEDGARGPAINLIVSLVVVTLILTKGTGFINDWTGLL